MNLKDLKNRVGWVVFTYPDQSVRVIKTTTDWVLLESVMKTRKPNSLYDLDKQRWVPLPRISDFTTHVFETPPQLGGQMSFVNKFI